MIIRLKTHGHQMYYEHVGEVLAWTMTIDSDGRHNYLQVPAVLLRVEAKVLLLPLQTRYTHTEIEVLEP